MKHILITIIGLFLISNVNASTHQECAAFASLVNAALMKRVEGVSKEKATASILNDYQVAAGVSLQDTLTESDYNNLLYAINMIVDLAYMENDDFPSIESGADIAAIVGGLYRECMAGTFDRISE